MQRLSEILLGLGSSPAVHVCLCIFVMATFGILGQAAGEIFSTTPTWSSEPISLTMSVAVGDVDGDGDLDLVCGNRGGPIALYLGENGILSVNPAWTSDTARFTESIALGDINGDGKLDLVCGNHGQPVKLYLGYGGVFSEHPAWSSAEAWYAKSVALGDVDGDGDLDLVCGNQGQRNTLYRNDGGTLSADPVWSSRSAGLTASVVLGDVDGDGDLDLVCGNNNQPNQVYLNEGGIFPADAAWSSDTVGYTTSMALGDVDGDGDLDLVCGYSYGRKDALCLNEGGVFSQNPAWSSGSAWHTMSVSLGDVDADGDLDLMCGNLGESNMLYLNEGGVFSANPSWSSNVAEETHCVTFGDLDGDGAIDLVCGNSARKSTLYDNKSAPLSVDPTLVLGDANGAQSVVLADVDGDGDLDLACGNYSRKSKIYLNEGGAFAKNPAWLSDAPWPTTSIVLGDVDGNDTLDVVCGNSGQATVLYLNLASEPAWKADSAYDTWGVALGDVNGDGAPDLVCGNYYESKTLYLNRDGTFSPESSWTPDASEGTVGVTLGDVDGDGDLDLVCANDNWSNDQPNSIYLNDCGAFPSEPSYLVGPLGGNSSVALGDVDGDGDLDLVCGNDEQSSTLYLNQGQLFSPFPAWSSPSADRTESIALGDVDGDGDLDLVCGNPAIGSVDFGNTLYLGEKGVFSRDHVWMSAPNGAQSVALGDVDRDGDLDLVFGNAEDPNTIYMGLRNPPFKGEAPAPRNQLPNNSAYLRGVTAVPGSKNRYHLDLTVIDVESDLVWIVPEYQFEGAPWHRAEIVGSAWNVGPLASSPLGIQHQFYWDVSTLSFDPRDVILRLRVISNPMRVGLIQRVPSYNLEVGRIDVRRAVIGTSADELAFPTVTVGDTVALHITVSNRGNDTLTVGSIDLPSTEMRTNEKPPFAVNPGDSVRLTVFLEPRDSLEVHGAMTIESNDPITPITAIGVHTDIRALQAKARLLTASPELPLGEAVTVVITPADQVRVERGYVYYRARGGPGAFPDSIPISRLEEEFISVIPGEGVTEAGLEYYVKVENSGIFATDPPGAPEDSVFYQAVTSPDLIASTPQTNSGNDFLEGREINVFVSLPNGAGFTEGTLYFRRGGETAYHASPVQRADPLPVGVITDSLVGPRGLEYWVAVRTLTRTLTDPRDRPEAYPHVIRVTVRDLVEDDTHPASAYRMITVPLDFGADFTGTLEALLSDQEAFGPYDPVKWRAFRYVPQSGDYVELSGESSEEFQPSPGRAYWLISRSENWISTAPVKGYSAPTDHPYEVVLEPGWNQIGDPFVFAVAWDSILADTLIMAEAEGVVVEPPVRWTAGEGYQYGVEVLEPFEGYWVKNLGDSTVVLRIPPREAAASAAQNGPSVLATGPAGSVVSGGTAAGAWVALGSAASPVSSIGSSSPAPADGWRIEIRASSCGAVDFANFVGVSDGGQAGWDRQDRSEPPMSPGKSLSLYFPHMGWEKHAGRYASDIRGDNEALARALTAYDLEHHLSQGDLWGHAWRFDVAKSFSEEGVGDEVDLEFLGIEGVPVEASVYLIDRQLGRLVDLRMENHVGFYSGNREISSEEEARFILLVGSKEFVDTYEGEFRDLPVETVLRQNRPNPFVSSTIIRYEIAQGGNVSLRIYDASGALVRVLYDGYCEPGRYETAWNGENERGRRAATGIYFCQMATPTGFRSACKMLLMK